MGEGNDSAPFERFNIDVNLLLIPGILLVIFVGMASSLNILCLVRQLSLHVILYNILLLVNTLTYIYFGTKYILLDLHCWLILKTKCSCSFTCLFSSFLV
jgi:hypothetical protein